MTRERAAQQADGKAWLRSHLASLKGRGTAKGARAAGGGLKRNSGAKQRAGVQYNSFLSSSEDEGRPRRARRAIEDMSEEEAETKRKRSLEQRLLGRRQPGPRRQDGSAIRAGFTAGSIREKVRAAEMEMGRNGSEAGGVRARVASMAAEQRRQPRNDARRSLGGARGVLTSDGEQSDSFEKGQQTGSPGSLLFGSSDEEGGGGRGAMRRSLLSSMDAAGNEGAGEDVMRKCPENRRPKGDVDSPTEEEGEAKGGGGFVGSELAEKAREIVLMSCEAGGDGGFASERRRAYSEIGSLPERDLNFVTRAQFEQHKRQWEARVCWRLVFI